MPIRLMAMLLVLVLSGCSTATYIRANAADNPLDRVAQQAQEDWSVERVDVNTLNLSDAWPIHSVFSFGYTASHANLVYDPSTAALNIRYYLQSNQLFTLFIPIHLDAEPGFVGGALKPIMNDQVNEIVKWSGTTVKSRHAGPQSDPFPPHGTAAP